jgi:Bacterial antitoxin of type II TA system, VapB
MRRPISRETGGRVKTNLDIDKTLLKQAMALSGGQSVNAVIKTALEEFIAKRSGKSLLELFGKVDWDESYDYKAERSRK